MKTRAERKTGKVLRTETGGMGVTYGTRNPVERGFFKDQ